jgi:hypothetical protein
MSTEHEGTAATNGAAAAAPIITEHPDIDDEDRRIARFRAALLHHARNRLHALIVLKNGIFVVGLIEGCSATSVTVAMRACTSKLPLKEIDRIETAKQPERGDRDRNRRGDRR